MGNRAVLAIGSEQEAVFGIYLHWDGGRESVQAFLDATRELMKERGADPQYGPARLIQVIGNFLGGTLSLGLGPLSLLDTDNGDNGTYYIHPGSLQIISQKYWRDTGRWDKEHYDGVLADCMQKNSSHFYAKEPA